MTPIDPSELSAMSNAELERELAFAAAFDLDRLDPAAKAWHEALAAEKRGRSR